MKKKNETKENTETRKTTYWPHRPGFNWLLGYTEGKPLSPSPGLQEINTACPVKDGRESYK